MNSNRRGALAAILCSPLSAQVLKRQGGTIVVELGQETKPVLEVRHKGKVVKFTADELMAALEPPVFPAPVLPLPN